MSLSRLTRVSQFELDPWGGAPAVALELEGVGMGKPTAVVVEDAALSGDVALSIRKMFYSFLFCVLFMLSTGNALST